MIMPSRDALQNAKISVWWDVESCPFPRDVDPLHIAQNVSSMLLQANLQGPVSIAAFVNMQRLDVQILEALSSTGITVNCLPTGKRHAVDKAILVDMLFWALDNPPLAHLMLISCNADFANALHRLRMKGYNVLLVQSNKPKNLALEGAATSVWYWTGVSAQPYQVSVDDMQYEFPTDIWTEFAVFLSCEKNRQLLMDSHNRFRAAHQVKNCGPPRIQQLLLQKVVLLLNQSIKKKKWLHIRHQREGWSSLTINVDLVRASPEMASQQEALSPEGTATDKQWRKTGPSEMAYFEMAASRRGEGGLVNNPHEEQSSAREPPKTMIYEMTMQKESLMVAADISEEQPRATWPPEMPSLDVSTLECGLFGKVSSEGKPIAREPAQMQSSDIILQKEGLPVEILNEKQPMLTETTWSELTFQESLSAGASSSCKLTGGLVTENKTLVSAPPMVSEKEFPVLNSSRQNPDLASKLASTIQQGSFEQGLPSACGNTNEAVDDGKNAKDSSISEKLLKRLDCNLKFLIVIMLGTGLMCCLSALVW